MRIRYKVDILSALRRAGYTTYYLRQSKLLCENTIQAIRTGQYIAPRNLCKISILLERHPAELAEYLPDEGDLRWVNQRIEECSIAADTEA